MLRYAVSGAVSTVTFDQPERLNALSTRLLEDLVTVLERAATDAEVRVVVLTGAGRAFSAGGDLLDDDRDWGKSVVADATRLRSLTRSSELLYTMPKVTIAAINGACAGGALSLACAADLRYAASSAVFTTAFLKVGRSGDFGVTWTLPRLVGAGRARELLLRSERIDAAVAERIGLVSAVIDDKELMPFVLSVASELAEASPLAVEAIKRNLNDALESTFVEQLVTESSRNAVCASSIDARRAAKDFVEKRSPEQPRSPEQ